MPTVLELLNISSDYLDKKGIESPRLNAELLLSHVLECKRLNLYLSFDRPLKEVEVDKYRELIRRRKDREPLQYIIGEVEFYGIIFKINNKVLIPRPETEILVETIINENKGASSLKILDIGTGSGCIAVSLAKNLPECSVTALDISEDAIEVASSNASSNTITNVEFQRVDILNDAPFGSYDIIVSNPPYIALDEYDHLEPELKVYEPKLSLTDYADGTLFYKTICQKSSFMLNEGGKIYFELGLGLHSAVNDILIKNGFSEVKAIKDYQNILRVITGTKQ